MALFMDGPISNIDDLAGQDSQLLDVANVEGIDVTRKLALAQDEASEYGSAALLCLVSLLNDSYLRRGA